MEKEKIIQELKEFFVEELLVEKAPEEITNEMSLGKDLEIDSLGFTELMAHIEDAYNVKIKDEEFVPDNFRNLNCIINLLEQKGAVA